MKPKVILDPSGRRLRNIFSRADLARVHAVADVVWGKDKPMPPEEIDAVRDDVEVIVAGGWRYGDVTCFPKLRAVLGGERRLPVAAGARLRRHASPAASAC